MEVIEQNARLILHNDSVPSKVVQLADSLILQSSTSIPLKSNQEPARIHICCALAIEKLGEKLGLPVPDTRKPPIPPAQYIKLLNQFRSALISPSTPKKPQSTATPQSTPRRARSSRIKAVDLLKDELDDPDTNDDDEFHDLELDEAEDNSTAGDKMRTPRKRPPSGPRHGSPSPRKSPRKKSGDPTQADIKSLGLRMGLQGTAIDAVLQAFDQYKELVKDAWGLVYGLLIVVSDRSEPIVGAEHERRLVRALTELHPHVVVDREEWVNWVEKIVTGQTWIMNISEKPEPQPTLVGAPGGWGLGVEFQLVE